MLPDHDFSTVKDLIIHAPFPVFGLTNNASELHISTTVTFVGENSGEWPLKPNLHKADV
jgi:hypothetical protein